MASKGRLLRARHLRLLQRARTQAAAASRHACEPAGGQAGQRTPARPTPAPCRRQRTLRRGRRRCRTHPGARAPAPCAPLARRSVGGVVGWGGWGGGQGGGWMRVGPLPGHGRASPAPQRAGCRPPAHPPSHRPPRPAAGEPSHRHGVARQPVLLLVLGVRQQQRLGRARGRLVDGLAEEVARALHLAPAVARHKLRAGGCGLLVGWRAAGTWGLPAPAAARPDPQTAHPTQQAPTAPSLPA